MVDQVQRLFATGRFEPSLGLYRSWCFSRRFRYWADWGAPGALIWINIDSWARSLRFWNSWLKLVFRRLVPTTGASALGFWKFPLEQLEQLCCSLTGFDKSFIANVSFNRHWFVIVSTCNGLHLVAPAWGVWISNWSYFLIIHCCFQTVPVDQMPCCWCCSSLPQHMNIDSALLWSNQCIIILIVCLFSFHHLVGWLSSVWFSSTWWATQFFMFRSAFVNGIIARANTEAIATFINF